GGGPSCVAVVAGPWATITDFLVQRFPAQPREVWLHRMAAGEVIDERGVPVTEQRPFQSPLRLYYYRHVPDEVRIPFEYELLFQDEHLVVMDKPHFLPVVPSGDYLQETALVRLKRQLAIDTLVPIHRIDRDTAGLVLFSVRPDTRKDYQALFREHRIRKSYLAVALWRADLQLPMLHSSRIAASSHFMQQCEVAGPPNTSTHITLLQRANGLGLYSLQPVTGHRHQLRVHMASLGIPIAQDGIYPVLTPEGSTDTTRPLQLLAESLEFTDPVNGQPRHFSSRRRLALARDLFTWGDVR
ncbi:MAG: pseudouridine synthase, partial [Rhodoferax sp.]|nr:pseudouridine synthase [Rhodoferax sp.]